MISVLKMLRGHFALSLLMIFSLTSLNDVSANFIDYVVNSHDNDANIETCKFPFLYGNEWYNECITTGYWTRWCSLTSNYTGSWGECTTGYCTSFPHVAGTVHYNSPGEFDTMTYSCASGYNNGQHNLTVKCKNEERYKQYWMWNATTIAQQINCKANKCSHDGEDYPIGFSLSSTCQEGYYSPTANCQENGTWSANLNCHKRGECKLITLPAITDGVFKTSDKTRYHGGDLAEYTCTNNSSLPLTKKVVCLYNGTWLGEAQCYTSGTGNTEKSAVEKEDGSQSHHMTIVVIVCCVGWLGFIITTSILMSKHVRNNKVNRATSETELSEVNTGEDNTGTPAMTPISNDVNVYDTIANPLLSINNNLPGPSISNGHHQIDSGSVNDFQNHEDEYMVPKVLALTLNVPR